ncbi:MAG: GntR family transcriptional regulator [Cryobacterium sp.]
MQDAIREDIVRGTLPPGGRITEVSLAASYGTSRVPVREALHALEAEGFVESRPFVGSRVCPIPSDDAGDLFAVRHVVESALARRAAERAAVLFTAGVPSEQWATTRHLLATLLDAGDAAVAAGALQTLPDINSRFHFGIAELSGSASLTVLLQQVSRKIEWLYASDEYSRGKRLWNDHRPLMAAIDAGDATLAERLMSEHVGQARTGYFTGR